MQLAERAQDKTVIKHRYFSTVFSGLFSKRAISSPRPPQILFFFSTCYFIDFQLECLIAYALVTLQFLSVTKPTLLVND